MLLSNFGSGKIEAGLDEAGRGCLAGPVVAAAVILPENYTNELLNDSKKLSAKKREILREEIERDALFYAICEVSHTEIDKINILNASFLAMHRCVDALEKKPELLLIDGNRFKPYNGISHECIIKGDGKYASIAAASILAKTYRDNLMSELGEKYPAYQWKKNAGYPTKAHREAIREHGPCEFHRMTFKLLPEQKELPF
ncbi:ribonuclease HII [Sediminitomix flava]|uniref:Ribonuclease HII n=1 Tax=Sediminitomix flava TaxID=379075 RepID=A0A315ZC14_SEDFL|nr:ribonuclease HII [Sediminitomix flava]PWJ42338.1 RNase HII [Sediminitomix flava]